MLGRVLLTTDAVGGVWQYSMELARGFAAAGVEVVLAVLGPPPDATQRRDAAAIPQLRLVVTGLPLDWTAETVNEIEVAAASLAVLASQVGAGTVQLHAPALVGQANWPVPIIAVAHSCVATWWRAVRGGDLPSDLGWRAAATAAGIARADSVIAPSRSFADALRACYGTGRPIDAVLNGRKRVRGRAARRVQVLTAGRLWDEAKNIASLDAAAAALPHPIMAAGSVVGPNGAAVACRHMQMLGALDDTALANEYARASVFVSVALYEPFGLAVLEAAQAGCALLLSDIPTFRELWDGAAMFVPPKDIHAIAAGLQHLLADPGESGAAARRRAASFDAQSMVDAMLDIHTRHRVGTRTAA